MRRSLALVLLIGLIAAILWWLASGAKVVADNPIEPGSSSQAPAPGALLAGGGFDANPDAASALQRDAAELTAPEAPLAGAADPAETFRVRVVRAEDGAPVPGAEVLYMDLTKVDQKEMRAAMRRYDDTEKVLEELGVLFTADADGVALLPLPPSSIWIAARHDDLYGTVWGMTRSNLGAELEIRLQTAIHVRVHVEDETQTPLAGVPVAYMTGDGLFANANAQTETDEHGDAELRHLETVFNDYGRRQRNRIVALLPGLVPPGAEFAPENPPREPIRIVVPRCGSVLAEVFDLAGALVGDGIPVTLQSAPSLQQREEWKENYGAEPPVTTRDGLGAQTVFTTAGRAHFPNVPIGQHLEFFGSPDRSGVQVSGAADGPLRPGEEVHIRLQQDAVHPRLTGRVVTADGVPLTGVTVMSTYWRGWPHHAGTWEQGEFRPLDADGRFSRILDETEVPSGTARVLAIHRTLDEASRAEMGWVFVPERVAESGHDVGDVMLGGPIAAAGRVVKPDGTPVAQAWLHWRAHMGPVEPPMRGGHQELTEFIWRTNADGQFSLAGNLPGTNHHLSVSAPDGGRQLTIPFELGAQDLEIVLAETGKIRGRLLLDPGIPGNFLFVDFHRTDPVKPGEPANDMDWPDAVSGEFVSPLIPPGTWSVRARTNDTGDILATVEGIQVRDGEAAQDPRLQIDLRGRLHFHRLTVLDADGNRPDPVHLYLRRSGQWTDIEGENPRAFLATESALSGFVSAEGWGRSAVSFPGGDVEVRLGRGIPVRIELSGAGLAEVQRGLSFSLLSAGDSAELPRYRHSVTLREPWIVATGVPEAGAYRIQLHYTSPGKEAHPYGWQSTLRFATGGDYEFRVGPGTEQQIFRVEITPEMAAAAVAEATPR